MRRLTKFSSSSCAKMRVGECIKTNAFPKFRFVFDKLAQKYMRYLLSQKINGCL